MKMNLQISIFLSLIATSGFIHASAAVGSSKGAKTAAAAKESAEVIVHSKKVTPSQWKYAKYRILAAIRQGKIKALTQASSTDSDCAKLQKEIHQLRLIAAQTPMKEELLQAQYEQNKELKAKVKTLEHSNRLYENLNKQLAAENKIKAALEAEKKKLEEELKQLSVKNAELVSAAALSESTAAADLP